MMFSCGRRVKSNRAKNDLWLDIPESESECEVPLKKAPPPRAAADPNELGKFEAAVDQFYSALELGTEVVALPFFFPKKKKKDEEEEVEQLPGAMDLLAASVDEDEKPAVDAAAAVATEITKDERKSSVVSSDDSKPSVVSADSTDLSAFSDSTGSDYSYPNGIMTFAEEVTMSEWEDCETVESRRRGGGLLSLFSCASKDGSFQEEEEEEECNDALSSSHRSRENKERSPYEEQTRARGIVLLEINRKKGAVLQERLAEHRKTTRRLQRRDVEEGRTSASRQALLDHEIMARRDELEMKKLVLESMRLMETMADHCDYDSVAEEEQGCPSLF